jgi:hypothetical protein
VSAPRILRKLVDEELERRHEKHAAHCDGECFQGNNERSAATIAVALALIEDRDAALSQAEALTRALRQAQQDAAAAGIAHDECLRGVEAAVALLGGGGDDPDVMRQLHAAARRVLAERDAARAMVERAANDVVALRCDLEALRAAVWECRDAESARDDAADEYENAHPDAESAALDALVAATSRVVRARVELVGLVPGASDTPKGGAA